MRARVGLATAIVLVGVLVSTSADSRTASKRCLPQRSRTTVVLVNPSAVIYKNRINRYFGCLRSRGRSFLLGGASSPGDVGDLVFLHHLRLAGRFEAHGLEYTGRGPKTLVATTDLRTGRRRIFATGPRHGGLDFGSGDITDLVLNERGSTAWILANYDDPTTFQVRLARRTGSVELEMSKVIDPRSLVRKGARGFCWTSAGVQHCRNLYR